jgi:hypothetical protein
MTPFDQAKQVYSLEPCARTFEEDLMLHFRNGYVISTPGVFLMFRGVRRYVEQYKIVDPAFGFFRPNCWHVYLAAGDPLQFHKHFPYPLPWVSGERNNRLRFYRFHKIAEKLASRQCKITTDPILTLP